MQNSVTIIASGASIATGAAAARVAIPKAQSGEFPRFIRVAASATASIRLGTQAVAVTAVAAAAGTVYAPTDTVTLTGGTFSAATVLTVATTKIISAAVNAAGTGYVPNDTVTLAGGTFTTAGIFTVTHTKVVSATIVAAGSGGTNGAQTVTGTTGTGTKFQASVTITGGVITAVNSISLAGDYTANPTIAADPVTGPGPLTGATLAVVMGVLTTTVTNAGVYSVNAAAFTQSATSGVGTGVTFNTTVFGVNTVTVTTPGNYSVLPANPVAQGASSGAGTGATFTMTWSNTGLAATTADTQIQPGDALTMHIPNGVTDISAIQLTVAGTVQISALENM